MPTAIDRLDALEPQLESLRFVREERLLLQALRTRATQMSAKRRTLEEQLDALERVERLKGGSIENRPRASAPFRAKPAMLKLRLEASPADLIDNVQWDASFITPLDAFTTKLQEAVLGAWQALVDENAPVVGDDVLNQFELTGFRRQVREVRAARDRIRQLRNQLPSDDSVLGAAQELSQLAARELAALEAVPAEVSAFIAKAAADKASLEDLTTEVTEWLRDRDMLKLIRVGLKT